MTVPVPMILTCPTCCARHVDLGEFATKPHHTHACQACGMVWRPALVPTVGVQFLPGFKDGDDRPQSPLPWPASLPDPPAPPPGAPVYRGLGGQEVPYSITPAMTEAVMKIWGSEYGGLRTLLPDMHQAMLDAAARK